LKSGERLSIVAVGSSSTVGLWVVRSGATYPEVMRQELARLRSNAAIEVVNSGRVGDTIEGNVARFQRDVLAHRPDLVVWQLGTNDVAWGGHPDDRLKSKVVQGVQMLKASGADVILMDLQYAPMVHSAFWLWAAALIITSSVVGFGSRLPDSKSITVGLTPMPSAK
jgi:lysophospholipase L1-like esterase